MSGDITRVGRFTPDEIERLPAKHTARSNPNLEVERSEVRCVVLPPLALIENRVDVLFYSAEPMVRS